MRTLKMLLHPEDVPRAPVMAEAVRGRIVSLLSPDAAGGDTVSQHACEVSRVLDSFGADRFGHQMGAARCPQPMPGLAPYLRL